MRFRCLPPVTAPSTPGDLLSGLLAAIRPVRALGSLEGDFRTSLGARHVFLVSSGRAALTIILRALARTSSRRRVIAPAYTCFSVAASVVKAGLDLVLCDISPATLDFDYDALQVLLTESAPLCVISTHLFGVPADTRRTLSMCRPHQTIVVEDAAQAFGFCSGDRWLGTAGDVGFFSFGRGKTVSACGGGAIVTNSTELGPVLRQEWQQTGLPSSIRTFIALAQAATVSVFVRPALYWLPAHLPFLGIGQTRYSTDFRLERMSGTCAGLLRSWRARASEMNGARVTRLAQLAGAAGSLAPTEGVPLLRLPIMCRTRVERDRLCDLGRREGLGIVRVYPTALNAVPELAAVVGDGRYPGAEAVAERLVTVPVHPLVSDSEIASIRRVLAVARAAEA